MKTMFLAVLALCTGVFGPVGTSDTPPGFTPRVGVVITTQDFKTHRFAIDWGRRVEAMNRKTDFDRCVYPSWKQTVAEHKSNDKTAVKWLVENWKYGMSLEAWMMNHERERKRMESE